jgi:hypothetical protein
MNKKFLSAALAIATITGGIAATPAAAHYRGGYYDYDDRDYYGDRRRARCDRGTGGTIIGGVVGGLAGREIARRGNRTEATIIGAAVGALAGRAIDKSDSRRPCGRRYR